MSEPLIGMAHIRTAAADPTGNFYPEWLQIIHDCNDLDATMFGNPIELAAWWAGGSVEEYIDARVLHREDPSVSIIAKTEHGNEILRTVAAKRGIHVSDTVSVLIAKEEPHA